MSKNGIRLGCLGLLLWGGNLIADLQTIPLPVTLNGREIGEVNTRLKDATVIALRLGSIRSALKESLSDDRFARLPGDAAAWVNPGQLEAAGVQVKFDFQNLILHLTIPPEISRMETLDLIGRTETRANRTVLPGNFSTFLNLRGGVDYVESSPRGATGFGDPRLRLENAFNLNGWVLENDLAINPAIGKTWEKRDTRLVFDQPERRWRWTLGDLTYPVTGFQSFLPMAGLSLHRENSLQPYRITSPLGQSSFYLKENSQVEVLVNGHVVRTLRLNAGPHQINNFPLTGGANDVILRITDPVGRVEYINTTFFYEPGALRQGETEFNYAVGLPSQPDPVNPLYDYISEPFASAFHRWGLTDQLTVGVNGQISARDRQAGAGVLYNTSVGVFTVDAVSSDSRDVGWGHAERLQYRYYAPGESLLRDASLNLAIRRTSDRFVSVSPFTRAVPAGEGWDWQARYSQRLTDHFSGGLGYSEQHSRSLPTARSHSLTLSHRWRRVSTDITVQRNEGGATGSEWAGFFTLIIHLDQRATTVASYDTSRRASQGEVQFDPIGGVDSLNGTLGAADVAGRCNVYGNLRYYGPRAELTLSQNSVPGGESRASLNWGTALVYADGQFGVSRPVQDAFAIFSSTGSLNEEGGLGVQPQLGRFGAREDWLGPAVLPRLTSYYPTRVAVEPLVSNAEFDPQEGDVLLKPTYRSGTLVRIGRASTAHVTAALVWADGRPAALQSGGVTASGGTRTDFITNREGRTYLHGLPAGTYRAALDHHPDASFVIKIPTDKNINVDLGAIRVPTTE